MSREPTAEEVRDHFEHSDVCDDPTCTPENFLDAHRNQRPTELRWYNDPGHGWLAVTVRELLDSGVASDVSRYSYHDAQTAMVYLEEDCDAARYLDAHGFSLEEAGVIAIENTTDEDSFIRSLEPYTPGAVGA